MVFMCMKNKKWKIIVGVEGETRSEKQRAWTSSSLPSADGKEKKGFFPKAGNTAVGRKTVSLP